MRKHTIMPLRNTIHDQTIQQMMDANPLLKRGNFFKECIVAFPGIQEAQESFCCHPDIFLIDKEKRSIQAIEIEDYNKLSTGKLVTYGNMWDRLEGHNIALSLAVYGRYGGDAQDIDLKHWFYYGIKNASPVVVKTHQTAIR